jgi:uncharacterized protein
MTASVVRRRLCPTAAVRQPNLLAVRRSRVHGLGVFARRRIRKGTRVIEYLGERISHREADWRYEHKRPGDNHTFLFIVDRGVVVDAGVGGNQARFINHCCDPNCESVIDQRRIFIEAVRTIQPGEELTYDYRIGRDRSDPPNVDEIFACRCGAESCRGSMLWPRRRKHGSHRNRGRARTRVERNHGAARRRRASQVRTGRAAGVQARGSRRTQRRAR